jgi:hypothetical protein
MLPMLSQRATRCILGNPGTSDTNLAILLRDKRNFSDDPGNFFVKQHLATNLATFKMYLELLATFEK